MTPLAALVIGAVALFGIGASRVALQDLALLEAQEAAQRSAEAAAGRAAELIIAGAPSSEVDAAAQSESRAVAGANLSRGTADSVSVTRSASARDLVDVTVTLAASYGGFAGPIHLTVSGVAAVPRP